MSGADPIARPGCMEHLIDARERACRLAGVPAGAAFARARRGLLHGRTLRGWRRDVWAEMRRAGYSYPEIAEACGVSHSTVIETLRAGEQGRTCTGSKP